LRHAGDRFALTLFFAGAEDLAFFGRVLAFLAWPEECVDLNEAVWARELAEL